jgi:hypothetical protein
MARAKPTPKAGKPRGLAVSLARARAGRVIEFDALMSYAEACLQEVRDLGPTGSRRQRGVIIGKMAVALERLPRG